MNEITKIRNQALNLKSKKTNDRFAVIVLTEYAKNKFNYGIQYWTNQMINTKYSKNTDNTISKFIEMA